MSIVINVKKNRKNIVIASAIGVIGMFIGYILAKKSEGKLGFARATDPSEGLWGRVDAHFPNRTEGMVTTYRPKFDMSYLIDY